MDEEKLISNEDMQLLLDAYTSSGERWEILIASPDKAFCSQIDELYGNENNIDTIIVDNGCDALVSCAMNYPHLIVIDEELQDIPSDMIAKCIQRRSEFNNIKIIYALKSDTGADSTLNDKDDYFVKTGIDKTYLARKISAHLFSSDHYAPPKRRFPRMNVNMEAELTLHSTTDLDNIVNGTAKVINISQTGAFLTDIKLDNTIDDSENYTTILQIDTSPLTNWKAESIIKHLNIDNTAGIKFITLTKQDNLKLASMLGK